MSVPQFAVHTLGPGSGRPCFTGSLSACLDFIRHYMRGGATGFSIVPVQS